MAEKLKLKKVEQTIINVAIKIARRGSGALFVLGETEYEPLVDQVVKPFKIYNNPKLLESLALIDGAVIISREGNLTAYGVKIKANKIFKNFGTRHSAALSAAVKNNTVFLVSEEDKKIKIMKKGRIVMQIDALQKDIEKSVQGAVNLLESIGAGTIGVIGTSLLAPTLGVTLLPGIIIFGSAYYLGKLLHKKFKK